MFLYEALEAAPTCCAIISPLLNIASVGILNTLYFDASSPLSSTFTLTNFTLPGYSLESSSTTGLTILHGPHHSAQKTTNTGTCESITSVCQLFVFSGFAFFIYIRNSKL